jgi:hypothetical protein
VVLLLLLQPAVLINGLCVEQLACVCHRPLLVKRLVGHILPVLLLLLFHSVQSLLPNLGIISLEDAMHLFLCAVFKNLKIPILFCI